ncbi:hypothetical protein EYC80_006900 [Monilinia laxa]|uniref:Uncharacterized protein n=1 Tax=Monilinia laxa TaxID=61186 RepID=A0A5N6JZW9_MONLA|nr:hypothetical protein EYC80_006900 [Monilinia laxa]
MVMGDRFNGLRWRELEGGIYHLSLYLDKLYIFNTKTCIFQNTIKQRNRTIQHRTYLNPNKMSSSRGSSIDDRDDENFHDSPITPQSQISDEGFKVTSSLEDLQTDQQRRVLDTVAQLRNCGLEGVLPLPQLVVCGDQSAGKSSVLEALTEIPFPRNDNLCTRFATEISLRRANESSIRVKVIPDDSRPAVEQARIRAFVQTITDFDELPRITDMAMDTMGIKSNKEPGSSSPAFARDVLSIEICGPTRPQLTLVDLPGLIASDTEEATVTDVEMVARITEHYIKQPRTICLAVISAKNDIANQGILTRVRAHDPNGDRTLGIITKPDTLDAGSGSEKAFIRLAKNENVRFKLGWHVVRNRKFTETHFNLMERNMKEISWFQESNFRTLPKESVGIEQLRIRLSILLFEHIQRELPNLRRELEKGLSVSQDQLRKLGDARSTTEECKSYLVQLSADFEKLCKASVDGHYEGSYFRGGPAVYNSGIDSRRTRAVVQVMNKRFTDNLRLKGHKYQINMPEDSTLDRDIDDSEQVEGDSWNDINDPIVFTKKEAFEWVNKALKECRGMEVYGTYNPTLVSQLFWEQSEKWEALASTHMEDVFDVCTNFLKTLLHDKVPKDVESRLWLYFEEKLKIRHQAAARELGLLVEDLSQHPINYNHYFTDTIHKRREDRQKAAMEKAVAEATEDQDTDPSVLYSSYNKSTQKDMDGFSCEEALDNLFAIYKVLQKVFVANVTIQVVERHIVRGLENIFNPVAVHNLTSEQAGAISSEPTHSKHEREFHQDRIDKLEDGKRIFRAMMGGAAF